MQRYLDNLRKKPKAVRAQVGFAAAGSITAVFFLIWAVGLSERASVVSADPTIAEYQRQVEKAEIANKPEATGVTALFGQIKRGVAAVIFNEEKPVTEEKSLEEKVIDINAMIQNPQPRKKPSGPATSTSDISEIVVPVGENNSVSAGSMILIGTTSSNSAETSN